MKKFAGDIIILLMCTKNHNHMMYGFWYMEWDRQNFLSFWVIFCPFHTPPLMIPKIKILKKYEKKKPENIILLYMCTINEDHMIYGSWDIRCNKQKLLSFWAIFCPLSPLITWKIKIWKLKRKPPGDIVILHICTINDNHMMYGSWDMECDRQIFLSF